MTPFPGPTSLASPVVSTFTTLKEAETNLILNPLVSGFPKLSNALVRSLSESPTAVMTVSAGCTLRVRSTRTQRRAVSATPPADAMILVESPPSGVATPELDTPAIVGTVDVQPNVVATGLPSGSFAIAVYWTVVPYPIVSILGLMTICMIVPVTADAVKPTGEPWSPGTAACIVSGPRASGVTDITA